MKKQQGISERSTDSIGIRFVLIYPFLKCVRCSCTHLLNKSRGCWSFMTGQSVDSEQINRFEMSSSGWDYRRQRLS
jgi:hypothetical protein